MIKIDIPGRETLYIKYALFDMNGTLTVDGKILESTKHKLIKLSKKIKIFILTADTLGKAKDVFDKLPVELTIVDKENGGASKKNFIDKLGCHNCVAIGNGFNDTLMLESAKIGISVLMEEGICTRTIEKSDIFVKHIDDALDLLLNPKRIIATLRK